MILSPKHEKREKELKICFRKLLISPLEQTLKFRAKFFRSKSRRHDRAPGTDSIKNISSIELCYAYFKHPDWFKNSAQRIRMLKICMR